MPKLKYLVYKCMLFNHSNRYIVSQEKFKKSDDVCAISHIQHPRLSLFSGKDIFVGS